MEHETCWLVTGIEEINYSQYRAKDSKKLLRLRILIHHLVSNKAEGKVRIGIENFRH